MHSIKTILIGIFLILFSCSKGNNEPKTNYFKLRAGVHSDYFVVSNQYAFGFSGSSLMPGSSQPSEFIKGINKAIQIIVPPTTDSVSIKIPDENWHFNWKINNSENNQDLLRLPININGKRHLIYGYFKISDGDNIGFVEEFTGHIYDSDGKSIGLRITVADFDKKIAYSKNDKQFEIIDIAPAILNEGLKQFQIIDPTIKRYKLKKSFGKSRWEYAGSNREIIHKLNIGKISHIIYDYENFENWATENKIKFESEPSFPFYFNLKK